MLDININALLEKWLLLVVDTFKVSLKDIILCYRSDKSLSYELWHREYGCLSSVRIVIDYINGLISLKSYCSTSIGPYIKNGERYDP
jgi:hypothetical protein